MMSEIDVSKCDYYFQGRCGVSKNINYSIGCYANDCYYKQLQQLKQENEELKKEVDKYKDLTDVELRLINDALETSMNSYKECSERYKQCVDEIEEIAQNCLHELCMNCKYHNNCNDVLEIILNIIKQAKESEE